jgi:hypothetical protein
MAWNEMRQEPYSSANNVHQSGYMSYGTGLFLDFPIL